MTSRQIEANRSNGESARGAPRDTSLSRFNAIDHALLARGITELDSADGFTGLVKELQTEWKPVGEVEQFLVERIALCIVRIRRSVRLEASAITAALHPPQRTRSRLQEKIDEELAEMGGTSTILDPGFQVQLGAGTVEMLAIPFGRYETMNERRLFRAIEELEHLQNGRRTPSRLAQGERPAPGG